MSSHWDWMDQMIADHDKNRPYAPENGHPLKFKAGDWVIYTNDYGIRFPLKVSGLYKPQGKDSLYATGSRYLLDCESPWMPVKEASLEMLPVPTATTF